jgi:hypothetical protein
VEETAHHPETREVYKIHTVMLGESRNVAHPPARGGRETMHQDDRVSFAHKLVINSLIADPDLTPGYFDEAPPNI